MSRVTRLHQAAPVLDFISPATEWAGLNPKPRTWLVDGLIPLKTVTILSGDGGLGKSTLALQLIAACATGRQWLGQPTLQCPAIGVFCEDDRDELHRRACAINQAEGVDLDDWRDVALVSGVGLDMRLAARGAGDVTLLQPFHEIAAHTRESGSRLIVLDALHNLSMEDENDRAWAASFIGRLNGLARELDAAILLCAHPSLAGRSSGTGESGSTSWSNAARARLYLKGVDGEQDRRTLTNKKSNYGPSGTEIRLIYEDGIFRTDGPTSWLDRRAEDGKIEQAFLDSLSTLAAQGVRLSASPSAAYAPKRLEALCRPYTKRALALAMDRLLQQGRLRQEESGPPTRRRTHLVVQQ